MNAASDSYTDKQPGWRLYADPIHFQGEYDIQHHSFLLSPHKPSVSAKAFLRSRLSVQGMLKLRFFQGAYWTWDESRYVKIEEYDVRSRLEEFLEMAVVRSGDHCTPFPTQKKYLDDIMESVRGHISLPDDVQLPYFVSVHGL